jgi:hypothetical protein
MFSLIHSLTCIAGGGPIGVLGGIWLSCPTGGEESWSPDLLRSDCSACPRSLGLLGRVFLLALSRHARSLDLNPTTNLHRFLSVVKSQPLPPITSTHRNRQRRVCEGVPCHSQLSLNSRPLERSLPPYNPPRRMDDVKKEDARLEESQTIELRRIWRARSGQAVGGGGEANGRTLRQMAQGCRRRTRPRR